MPAVEKRYFADFYSPGTFVSEQTRRPISSADAIAEAVELANGITERYGAKPYGFVIVACMVHEPVPDGLGGTITVEPKQIERSGTFYLGGRVLKYENVPDDKDHSILRMNMRCNRYPVVVENRNSYRHTSEFKPQDCIVGPTGDIEVRGDDPELVAYRAAKNAEWDRE